MLGALGTERRPQGFSLVPHSGYGFLPRVSFMADFVVALKADNFPTMATTAHWANITRDRRAQLQRLFTNAEYVLEQGGDYTTLNWPVTLSVARIAVGGKAC
jgi:hypothetical protein